MKHLKIEEIIDFVSAQRYDSKTAELASKVNTHIIGCRECLEKVNAYQTLYDELSEMCISKAYQLEKFKRVSFPAATDKKEQQTGGQMQANMHLRAVMQPQKDMRECQPLPAGKQAPKDKLMQEGKQNSSEKHLRASKQTRTDLPKKKRKNDTHTD